MPVFNAYGALMNPRREVRQRVESGGKVRAVHLSASRPSSPKRRGGLWTALGVFCLVVAMVLYFSTTGPHFLKEPLKNANTAFRTDRVQKGELISGSSKKAFLKKGSVRPETGAWESRSSFETPKARGDKHGSAATAKGSEAVEAGIRKAVQSGRWREAARQAQTLVRVRGTPTDRKLLGFLLINAGNYREGIAVLEALVLENAANAEVFHRLGHAYATQHFHEKAFRAFRRAVALEPENPRHYKCGTRLILIARERGDSRFQARLGLARTWLYRARELGAPSFDLKQLELDLSVYRYGSDSKQKGVHHEEKSLEG